MGDSFIFSRKIGDKINQEIKKIIELLNLANYRYEFYPNENVFIISIPLDEEIKPYILSGISDKIANLKFFVSNISYTGDKLEIIFRKAGPNSKKTQDKRQNK